MGGRRPDRWTSVPLTRRQALQLAGGAAALGLAGCAPSAKKATEEQSQGSLVLISTQFAPVQEAEKMRSAVLAGFGRKVEFLGEEQGPFEGFERNRDSMLRVIRNHRSAAYNVEDYQGITVPAGGLNNGEAGCS